MPGVLLKGTAARWKPSGLLVAAHRDNKLTFVDVSMSCCGQQDRIETARSLVGSIIQSAVRGRHGAAVIHVACSRVDRVLEMWIHTAQVIAHERASLRGAGWRPNQIVPCMIEEAGGVESLRIRRALVPQDLTTHRRPQ